MADVGDRLYSLMASLVACLCGALDNSPGGKTCFCGVVPGASATMDFCDCSGDGPACGMAWVRLDQTFPSVDFPIPLQTARSCRVPWAARLEVGVTRCLPGMDERGNPPEETAQANAVLDQIGDMAAIQTAIDCCMGLDARDYIIGNYTPLGPSGDCGGGTMLVTVWLPDGL